MMAAEHLIDSGYRRIIHYTFVAENKKKQSPLIGEGIKAVLKNRGLPESMFSCWLENEGEKANRRTLEKRKITCGPGCSWRLPVGSRFIK